MIHKYKINGYNIVLDVNSNSVHILDDIGFEILDKIHNFTSDEKNNVVDFFSDKFDRRDIAEAYDELYELFSCGMLFSKDIYAEKFQDRSITSPIKAMCINIAHDCNLACEYCFAHKGDFGSARMLMSEQTAKKAIDFLILHSENRHNLEVDFFGGEPLMNFDVVKSTINYARSLEKLYNKNFRFTITTNGVLLDDDKIDFINKEMSNVVLSLDGRKSVNDRMRPTRNGGSSFDVIVPKFQRLVASRGDKDYYIRGTFTKYNLDFSADVLRMYELGFDHLSIEPVAPDKTSSYAFSEEDLPKIFDEYEKLAIKILEMKQTGKNINFFHFMVDLDQGPCIIKKVKGCGCGNEYVAVTPEGDIYPCHQFVGKSQWKMGNLHDGTFDNDMKKMFSKSHLYAKEKCRNCWAKFFCSGGCNANNWNSNKNILKSDDISCKLEKKRLECAIMVNALLNI